MYGETDHTDPIGYFKKFGKTMDDFRLAVQVFLEEDIDMTKYEELNEKIEKMQKKLDKVNTYIYNYVDENMPEFARKSVQKLMDKGCLTGSGDGLNLTYDMLRIITVLDRANAFDN